MEISLRDLEPFNIPPVDDYQAGLFMKHLTGRETFEFHGKGKPKSLMFYDLKYNYPRHCFAHGYLLSVSIDDFLLLCGASGSETIAPILKKVKLGSLGIEFGGSIDGCTLYTGS